MRGDRRIVCAAVLYNDGNMLIGARHFDSVMHKQLHYFPEGVMQLEQGFIDQFGNFVGRTEAWKIALAAGQILYRCGGDDRDGGTLYSENLY